MRAFEGQRSDNQPVKRSRAEEKLVRELRETLAAMKSHASQSLRQSLQKRIADLEAELRAAAAAATDRACGPAAVYPPSFG